MLELMKKGNFQPINTKFLIEGHSVLNEVAKVQQKWKKGDTDTFINELRDSMVGHYLGYKLVNTEKHGFDCKLSNKKDIFLEVKSASFTAGSWGATFNDTNIEKAKCFQTKNVYLCLAVWKNASNLLFMVYGQNLKVGKWLEQKVKSFLDGNGVRSTQSISITQLINEYNFDIICVEADKKEVKTLLGLKNKSLLNLSDKKIFTLDEYEKNKFLC